MLSMVRRCYSAASDAEPFATSRTADWTDALWTLHPGERIYTFWAYFRNA
jgi:hypothetical protein